MNSPGMERQLDWASFFRSRKMAMIISIHAATYLAHFMCQALDDALAMAPRGRHSPRHPHFSDGKAEAQAGEALPHAAVCHTRGQAVPLLPSFREWELEHRAFETELAGLPLAGVSAQPPAAFWYFTATAGRAMGQGAADLELGTGHRGRCLFSLPRRVAKAAPGPFPPAALGVSGACAMEGTALESLQKAAGG